MLSRCLPKALILAQFKYQHLRSAFGYRQTLQPTNYSKRCISTHGKIALSAIGILTTPFDLKPSAV